MKIEPSFCSFFVQETKISEDLLWSQIAQFGPIREISQQFAPKAGASDIPSLRQLS